jgi:predicted GIY-YIG superfamily endonuclease
MQEMKYWIYFLLNDGIVVYVGQSQDYKGRVYTHKKDKVFNSVRAIECCSCKLNYYEKRWIDRFKPKYNKIHRDVNKRLRKHQLKRVGIILQEEANTIAMHQSKNRGMSFNQYVENLILEDCKISKA